MTKLSAVIVAHNEEKKIEGCLQSLAFVDEVVVVLDKCTDRTKEIVSKYTKKVIEGSWNIEGARRNVAVNAATGNWILEIDSDERISPELAKEIRAIADDENYTPCAFTAPIHNYIGKRYVPYGWIRTLGVLGRQTMAYRGFKHYHEDKEIHPTCDLQGEVKHLTNPIIHLVDDNVGDLIARFNRYTNWKANDMISRNQIKCGGLHGIITFKIRFFKAFISKKGYKEGVLGFLLAILAGLYPIVSHAKAKEKLKALQNENR